MTAFKYLLCGLFGITLPPEDRPQRFGDVMVTVGLECSPSFKRTYSVAIEGGFMVTIERSTHWRDVRTSAATITQHDGRRIYFSPDHIARDIIDKAILPEVESACVAIRYADAEFIRSKPQEFTDSQGVRWRRVPETAKDIAWPR